MQPVENTPAAPNFWGHGFADVIDQWSWQGTIDQIAAVTADDVRRVLAKAARNQKQLDDSDFMALISPAAEPFLEEMAQLAHKYTMERFGKTISMYIPMYITNLCTNFCVYCGFNHNNPFKRTVLTPEQIEDECKAIKRLGPFENLLIVSGEAPARCGVEYFEKALQTCRPYFHNLTIEVQPLKEEEYRRLTQSGLNGVVCFQETYNRERYRVYHPKGMKSYYGWRLNGYDRMGRAGVHKIGMGVLIGLEDWRADVTMMARHLRYLQRMYWRTRYSVNFPRMCPSESGYQPNVVMSDRELAQLTMAFRLFDHDVDISYSTREKPEFRKNMMRLGVTSMSAGSQTEPGGYATCPDALEQFHVSDGRSPREVTESIRDNDYDVVWKDWDQIYD